MAGRNVSWHGVDVRTSKLWVALGLVACGSNRTYDVAPPISAPADSGVVGDAGIVEDEGPLPPAPSEPGCAMTLDGVPLAPSQGHATLAYYGEQPSLELSCSGVDVELRRIAGPGEYEGILRYGIFPRPEYIGYRCAVRLDKLAIKDRGGLAARVRCDVPLYRAEGAAKPNVRIEGYVVLPPAVALLKGENKPVNGGFCTYSVKGEYNLEGRGGAFSSRCFDSTFGLAVDDPHASLVGTFCPTCVTYYSRGGCSAPTNVVPGDHAVAYDISCAFSHELSGDLQIDAHIDGPIVTTP